MDNHIGSKYNFKCCVCGDEAIGFHFGGFSCESCKAFFRRNAFKMTEFTCKQDGNCHIDRRSRRYCSFCRLAKCLSIGMKKDLIKASCINSKEFESSFESSEASELPQNNLLNGTLSSTDFQSSEIEHFHQICSAMLSFGDESKLPITGSASSAAHAFNLVAGYIRSMITFCKKLDAFKCLKPADQLILLKGSFYPLTTVRFAFMFNRQLDAFPVVDNENNSNAIYIKLDLCAESKVENLTNHFRETNTTFQDQMDNDINIRNLISALFLFNQRNGSNLSCQEFIRYQYFLYSRLLQRYLLYKYRNKSQANERYSSIMATMQTMDFAAELFEQMYSRTEFAHKVDVLDEILYT